MFGDLHGRVLPAFALARRYQDEFQVQLDGLLQVGDLGYFPDPNRLDSASRRHAACDPLELGVSEFNAANPIAGRFFQTSDPRLCLYFIAGNHEDHELLQRHRRSRDSAWPVDDFHRLWCIDDGRTLKLPSGLTVGGLWGIDGDAPKARRIRSPRVQIDPAAAERLQSGQRFDVLLTHESPRDAIWLDSGSLEIADVIAQVQPQLAFFGHYHTPGRLADCDFGRTRVYWMTGLELQQDGTKAEPQSVGLLTEVNGTCTFSYLCEAWLADFTRQNWQQWLQW
ncbi:MAG: metallophosphatase family protein [Planctomycetes bacterium]|nr:metallophosphatase family protein [Planctomycetota bacterium]